MPEDDLSVELELLDMKAAHSEVMSWQESVELPNQSPPHLNRQKAVSHVLSLCKLLKIPEVAHRFTLIHDELLDHRIADRLHPLALALIYQFNLVKDIKSTFSRGKLPPKLVEEASEMRSRLMSMVSYNLEEDPVAMVKISKLKSGTGYLDLASDLGALALIIQEYEEILSQDHRKYQPDCASEAQKMQQRILTLLNDNRIHEQNQINLYYRLWSILYFYYNEICSAGNWIFRRTEWAQRFQTLATRIRKDNVNKRKDKDEEEDEFEIEEPAEEPKAE